MLLASTTNTTHDISVEAEILSTRFTGTEPQVAIARIDMQDAIADVLYKARIYIEEQVISPDVTIRAISDKTILQSRHFIVNPGDLISIRILGSAADTGITLSAYLMTAGFNNEELNEAITRLEIRPTVTVLGPCSREVDPAFALSRDLRG